MMKEEIPADYEIYKEKKITFIVREEYAELCNELPWKKPSQIFSHYPLHPIQQGRGRVVVLPHQEDRGIFVKKLRHGGFFGILVKNLFSKKRILGDLINAHALRLEGFHSPSIIFIIMKKKAGPWYEGYIGEELIENAANLLEMIQQNGWPRIKNNVLNAVASELKKLHDKGFHHSDLNAGNILIRERTISRESVQQDLTSDEESVAIEHTKRFDIIFIDLDSMKKSKKVSPATRRRNIFRLFRSLKKYAAREKYTFNDDLYFLKSYRGKDERRSLLFEKFLPLHRFLLIFHRPYWILTRKK